MSEFKGIKGKWIIEYSNRDDSYDIYNESKDGFVCTTMNSSDIEKYNALLISKAPEMLAMLQELMLIFDKYYVDQEQQFSKYKQPLERLIKEATTL